MLGRWNFDGAFKIIDEVSGTEFLRYMLDMHASMLNI